MGHHFHLPAKSLDVGVPARNSRWVAPVSCVGPTLGLAALLTLFQLPQSSRGETPNPLASQAKPRETAVVLRPGIDPVELTPAQQEALKKIRKAPETQHVDFITMPGMASMTGAPPATAGVDGRRPDGGARFVVPMRDGREIALVRRRPTVKFDGGLTWRGTVEETGERAIIMLWKDGRLSGYFSYKGSMFMIVHAAGGVHAMTEVETAALPPDHAPVTIEASYPTTPMTVGAEPEVDPLTESVRRDLEAKKTTIDVMLLFTDTAASHYIQDPRDLLALAIESANESFASSGLGNISLRLVHSGSIAYDETGNEHFDHLYRMVDGAGPFGGVKRLRDEVKADIVGLIVHSPEGCGLTTRVGADSHEAYFVAHHVCAALSDTVAHEIGHILGARHDRGVDPTSHPHAYGHGFVNGAKWRDIMSYRQSCGGCPRIPFWSNPRILYQGEPLGTPASDNVRVILENAERVAQFR